MTTIIFMIFITVAVRADGPPSTALGTPAVSLVEDLNGDGVKDSIRLSVLPDNAVYIIQINAVKKNSSLIRSLTKLPMVLSL